MPSLVEKLRNLLDVTECSETEDGEIDVQFSLIDPIDLSPLGPFNVFLDARSQAVAYATIADLRKKYDLETATHMTATTKRAQDRRARKIAECVAIDRMLDGVNEWLEA